MTAREKNPASETGFQVTEDNRIPLGLPETALEIPEIPGYVTYWFLDTPGRIQRALRAGWEFLTREEVQLHQKGVSNDVFEDGNSDLGNRVSLYGASGDNGKAQMLYAMKIKEEWYKHDEDRKMSQVANVADAIRGLKIGVANEFQGDAQYRYDPFSGQRSKPGGMKF